ncbi:MAG: T9SS type A sorting domain-containing protein [Rudanella sp.]|nr:T9SS type A sorting domain-containing protein [Rudanella sp.]
MQRHLFIFFLSLSFSHAPGQTLPDRPDTATYFNVGPDQKETVLHRTVFYYNQKGNLIKSRTEAPVENDLCTSYLLTTYAYDSRDSLLEFMLVGSGKPDGAAFRSRFVFTRDEHGNKLSDESSLWDFNQKLWRKSARTTQTFDGQNRITSQQSAHFDKTLQAWGPSSGFTYSYTDKQQMLQGANQRITTLCDARNRVIKTTTEITQQQKTTLTHYTTIEYGSTNSILRQYNEPKLSQPYAIITTQLNAQGKPERVDYWLDQSIKRITNLPAEAPISRSYNRYQYDSGGRLLEQVNWNYPAGQAVPRRTSGVRYSYDNHQPEQPALSVYPNPTTGPVNLLNVGIYGCVERYEVLNQAGQLVQQATAQVNMKIAETPECTPKIDLTALPDGEYRVRLFLGNGPNVSEQVVCKKNR